MNPADLPHVPTWGLLLVALSLDALIGDPRWLPHPIRWMGWAITKAEPVFRRAVTHERLAGTLFALGLILASGLVSQGAISLAGRCSPLLANCVVCVLMFYGLSARSLAQTALSIHRLLQTGQVDAARRELSMIVGRDVADYQAPDIARATVETVAENFVDGVLAPLLFATIGGAPGIMVYKMINTLDSMVGYKNARYRHFGWAAARIDDLANYLPARLSVPIIAVAARILSGPYGRRAWRVGFREGSRHTSPNAGFPEAAFAGALGVRLNGPNRYGGVLVDKPYIGQGFGPVHPRHIARACDLMLLASWIALAVLPAIIGSFKTVLYAII